MIDDKKVERVLGIVTKNIPNFISILNMFTGFLVIFLNSAKNVKDYRMISWILILAAVVFDSFDGYLARRLGVQSDFGKQLDSFSDFISFGIAPIFILLSMESLEKNLFVLIVLFIYPLCGAYRLARFNISCDKGFLIGLPITLAGFILAVLGLLLDGTKVYHHIIMIAITTCLSFMMVSTFKVKRVLKRHIDEKVKSY